MTSVVLLHLWRQNRALLPAAAWWGAGLTIIFVGTVLMALRRVIAAPVSIVLGNSCIIGGVIAMYMGSRRFWGEPLPRWPWIWLGLTAVVLLLLSVVWPSYPLRLAIVPGLMAVVQLAHLHEVLRQRRQGTPLTVLMLDLDHFKRINDTHGHPMGDRVLRDFADRVRRALRATDRFGRYGGEEFIVLLPDTGAQAGCALAERIRAQALREGLPAYKVSLGVNELLPNDEPADPERALEGAIARADAALYEAKAQGRDRVVQAPGQSAAPAAPASAREAGSGSAWAPV